jgi:ATP-dependent DNA helicase RecQ
VRNDVAVQLALESTEILVGTFNRPNLVYRVARRRTGAGKLAQIREVIDRYAGDSGIVYCISRRNVEQLASDLTQAGYKALPYHAGMESDARRANQDAFTREETDIIVATVAFGMGIDKSNVRYVIHAGAPKSIEHYQQESGRAGRDSLEAECCLFHSAQDFQTWRRLMTDDAGFASTDVQADALKKLDHLAAYTHSVRCRHATLVEYFGETLDAENCGACDVCLGHLDEVADPLVISQKILSCVVRLDQFFGAAYTADVLVGAKVQRLLDNGHDRLSTYGLLDQHKKRDVRDWIEQLVGQGFLGKEGEYDVLKVSNRGWHVIRGEKAPRLLQPAKRESRRSKADIDGWDGVDRDLFQALRTLRRDIAHEKGVPAFVIFGDAALRDLARKKPTSLEEFLEVRGVGEKKRDAYGEAFIAAIATHDVSGVSV